MPNAAPITPTRFILAAEYECAHGAEGPVIGEVEVEVRITSPCGCMACVKEALSRASSALASQGDTVLKQSMEMASKNAWKLMID